MNIFKRKEAQSSCCSNSNSTSKGSQEIEQIKKEIKILGSGCKKCMELELMTRRAIKEMALDYDIEHITDFIQISSFAVMSTPALVINGNVVSCGKVLTTKEIKHILQHENSPN